LDGVKGEFQPVGNPNLVVDGAKIVLYGLLGDGKVLANFRFWQPSSKQLMMLFSRRVNVSTGRGGLFGRASGGFVIVETCLSGNHFSPS
jgi:hypothetical protein